MTPTPCRKHHYRTEGNALAAASRMLRTSSRRFLRVYECPRCGSWHLTHQWREATGNKERRRI